MTIVEEYDQRELAKVHAVNFVIRVVNVGVLVFVIVLLPVGAAIKHLYLNIFFVNAK